MQIDYISLDEHGLDEIASLWMGLNEHHQRMSLHFTNHYAGFTFARRKQMLIEKLGGGRLRVDIARDKEKGQAIGYCVSTITGEQLGEIESLYIDPAYRGLGIGETLTRKALDWMDAFPTQHKRVVVAGGNEQALPFYARFGFHPKRTILEQTVEEFEINDRTEETMKEASEYTRIRRADRAVNDDAWIKAFLNRSPIGVLAMAVDNQPFVNTNFFAYDPERHALYLHHASEGRMVETLHINPKVCFTTSEMGRLLPTKRSRGFSVEYSGVVVFGRASEAVDQAEMLHGLRLIMAKYAAHLVSGVDYAEITPDELDGVSVFRVDIDSWSAKRKQAPEDFPGAYRYEGGERSFGP